MVPTNCISNVFFDQNSDIFLGKNDKIAKNLWNLWYNRVARFLRLPAFLKDKILLKVALVLLAILSLVELIRLKKKESVGHY